MGDVVVHQSPSDSLSPAQDSTAVDPFTARTAAVIDNHVPNAVLPIVKKPLTAFAKLAFWAQDRDYHVWIMSLGFAFLFTSYPIQGVQTIRYPETGSYILIVLYSGYFATSTWATFFLDWWGLEWCLPWGPISYATWIACEFSGNNVANLIGAAFFGWGAGILWPAAGQLIATVSTPHNRASNAGIYQCAFHVGIWAGGLILGGVQNAFPGTDQISYDKQYAVFIGLCVCSVVTFVIHAITFRRRYRTITPAAKRDLVHAAASVAGAQPSDMHMTDDGRMLHRVQNDDGTVEFRPVSKADIKSETGVVSDLALSGGRADPKAKYTWATFTKRFWQPLQMLYHPVFGPLAPLIFLTGGMTQGWWNASFNTIVYAAGAQWNGWIYAIAESFAIINSIWIGIFYDKLRKKYVASHYRWIMYLYVVAYYALCAGALGAYYMSQNTVGDGPGQTPTWAFYLILTFCGAMYNTQLLCLEVSILTYLSTFLTYNADIAFSSKIGCEAAGYLLVFGLVNVLNAKWMIVILFAASVPCILVYLLLWHAPPRPVAELVNENELSLSDSTGSSDYVEAGEAKNLTYGSDKDIPELDSTARKEESSATTPQVTGI